MKSIIQSKGFKLWAIWSILIYLLMVVVILATPISGTMGDWFFFVTTGVISVGVICYSYFWLDKFLSNYGRVQKAILGPVLFLIVIQLVTVAVLLVLKFSGLLD